MAGTRTNEGGRPLHIIVPQATRVAMNELRELIHAKTMEETVRRAVHYMLKVERLQAAREERDQE